MQADKTTPYQRHKITLGKSIVRPSDFAKSATERKIDSGTVGGGGDGDGGGEIRRRTLTENGWASSRDIAIQTNDRLYEGRTTNGTVVTATGPISIKGFLF